MQMKLTQQTWHLMTLDSVTFEKIIAENKK